MSVPAMSSLSLLVRGQWFGFSLDAALVGCRWWEGLGLAREFGSGGGGLVALLLPVKAASGKLSIVPASSLVLREGWLGSGGEKTRGRCDVLYRDGGIERYLKRREERHQVTVGAKRELDA
jgi:hypothetical protein